MPARANRSTPPVVRRRRWLRFSLRTMLVMLTVACVAFGLFVRDVHRQRHAVAVFRAAGGTVRYDFKVARAAGPPEWLVALLGIDCLAKPVEVAPYWTSDTTDEEVALVGRLPTVERLILRGTRVSDGALAHLSRMPRLKSLDLFNTDVGDEGMKHVGRIAGLERLSLGHSNVTDQGVEHLRGLTSLVTLDLMGTRVSDAGIEHLSALSGLQNLWVDQTKVSDAGMKALEALPKLTWLSVSSTEVSEKGLKRFRAAAPARQVQHSHPSN